MTSRFADRQVLLLGAAVAIVLALVALLPDGVAVGALGWFLAGPMTTTLVAMSRSAAIRWSAENGRVQPRLQVVASALLVAVGLVVSIVHAGAVAWELS